MISLLVAMDENRLIGANNELPWYLPIDLKYFKEKTMNHTIIMGRKTYDSIGKPLPKRTSIVITRFPDKVDYPEDVIIVDNLEEIKMLAAENPEEEYFIIGGGEIFKEAIEFADRLYVTEIIETFTGDIYFPHIDEDIWVESERTKGDRDANNDYEYYFIQYDRK